MADTLSDFLRNLAVLPFLGGSNLAGGGIPSPDQLLWQKIQQNAQLPAMPDPSKLTQTQALPPGTTEPAQFRDPNLQSPEQFAQQYADKQNRNALIEGGLSGLAGLLIPHYGPMGRRTWLGQIGQGIETGLGGYNSAEQAQALQDYRQGQLGLGAARAQQGAARTQQGNVRLAQNQERIDLGQIGRWKVQAAQGGQLFSVNPQTGESKPVLKPDGTPMMAAEKDKFTFRDSDRGLIALNKRTGLADIVNAPGGGTFRRAPSIARSSGGRGGRAPADLTRLELAEARREWMADSTDPTTGLPKEDAPSFDDWLSTEWPKRRAAISGSGRGAAVAAGSAPGSPGLSRSPAPLKGRPVGTKVTVPGMGEAKVVRYEEGRAVLQFPDGREFRVKE